MHKQTIKLTWRFIFSWSFSCLFLLFSHLDLAAQTPNAWINEIHYDNEGTDQGEGVEIVLENAEEFDISLLIISLYDGNNGKEYGFVALSDENSGEVHGEFSIYNVVFSSAIQNGPDGIALSYDGTLIQFLSYEGSFAATDGVAEGTTSVDIEAAEGTATPVGYSLQLTGRGDRYATFSWEEASNETFGLLNNGQQLTAINGPPPVTGLQVEYVAPDQAQITWTKPIGIHNIDWNGVLLFASKGAPNNITLEGKDYTDFEAGGNVFGNGTAAGDSYTVARKQTDEDGTYIITGLEEGESYYFTAYTYLNVPGGQNDIFSEQSEEIIAVPVVSAVDRFTATPLFEKARLEWENTMGSEGEWWNEIMILASTTPIFSDPDQQEYAANNVFGEGSQLNSGDYVVYAGQGDRAVVYGLENGTDYFFKVFVRYDTDDNSFFWSTGVETSCRANNNRKYWAGTSANGLFNDAQNWIPEGVPEESHDVILDHQNFSAAYEVTFPEDAGIVLNSLKIIPNSDETITVKLRATNISTPGLTLLDEIEPLVIGDHGMLINAVEDAAGTLVVPHANILMEEKGAYSHSNSTSHAAILNNILEIDETIPGTIVFDVPDAPSYFISLSGKTFQTLILSSNSTYVNSGSDIFGVNTHLFIDENATLNIPNTSSILEIKGDLTLAGTLTMASPMVFNGETEQRISNNTGSPIRLGSVNINKPLENLILNTDLQIEEELKIDQGNLITGPNKVILDYNLGTPIVSGLSNNIIGNLEVIRNVGTQSVAFDLAGLTIASGEEDLGNVKVVRSTGTDAVIEHGDNQSIQRHWEVYPASPLTKERSLTFSWLEGEDEGFDLSRLQVWKESYIPDQWLPIGALQDGASRTLTITTDTLTRFTIADVHNPLPVTLLSFKATLLGVDVRLNWTTATEKDNAGFEIEKSTDGKTFHSIGFVKGNGSSGTPSNYEFADNAIAINSYYRLKQIDFDGKLSYSPIVYVVVSDPSVFSIHPNPVHGHVKINASTDQLIDLVRLYNARGNLLFEKASCSSERLEEMLNQLLPTFSRGLYILSIEQQNKMQRVKFIKD